jgi:hypothetical protein
MFQIEATFGTGWQDITHSIKAESLSRRYELHKNLKPTTNSVDFVIADDPGTVTKFLAVNVDTRVRITKDGFPWFTGYYKRAVDVALGTGLESTKVEVVDSSYMLRKKIDKNVWYNNQTVSAIVASLLNYAGVQNIQVEIINKVIDYVVFTEADDQSYSDAINNLLCDFGYVLYFDETDTAKVHNLILDTIPAPSAVYSTGPDGNIYGKLDIKSRLSRFDGVSVRYYNHEVRPGVTVFSDTTGATEKYSCMIKLTDHNGMYPPRAAADQKVYSEYTISGMTIIAVQNAHLLFEKEGIAAIAEFNDYYRKCAIKITGTGTITKLDVKGDAIVKTGVNIVKSLIEENTIESLEEIDSDYLTTYTDAQRLANFRRRYWEYSDKEYIWKSTESCSIGDIVQLREPTRLGIDFPVRITRVDYDDGSEYLTIYAEGIKEYYAHPVITVGNQNTPSPQPDVQIIKEGLLNRPTYEEIIAGFEKITLVGEYTTIPTIPTIDAMGTYKAIELKWDKQLNLSNLKHYELQVSDDANTWYSLLTDGTGWQGEADAVTIWPIESFVHGEIPLGSDIDENGESYPVGVELYYRVRRVTRLNEKSEWSDIVHTTTTPIPDGSLSRYCISANNLKVGVLQAYLATFTDVTITEQGVIGMAPDGMKRVRLDKDEISFEVIKNGEWNVIYCIGGEEPGLHAGNTRIDGVLTVGDHIPTDNLRLYYSMDDGSPIGIRESLGETYQDGIAEFLTSWSLDGVYI